jgi:hypothetical protein
MSLKARPVPSIPDETARVARAAFPGGTLYSEADIADLCPTRGQPAEAP